MSEIDRVECALHLGETNPPNNCLTCDGVFQERDRIFDEINYLPTFEKDNLVYIGVTKDILLDVVDPERIFW